jgi:hypothetical protein
MTKSYQWLLIVGGMAFLVLVLRPRTGAQEQLAMAELEPSDAVSSSYRLPLDMAGDALVLIDTAEPPPPRGVDWPQLFVSSFNFLALQHAFRCLKEQGTRDGFGGSFVGGYGAALGNMHGWSDGDPFLVNYVGHPMEGAVAAFIWQHNDRAYSDVVFGKSARYWKGKLRGAAFSYVYSLQFEIGPLSEASLGNIQSSYPAQGFVDHIVTPVVGLGWTIAEDSLDKYVIRTIEGHTRNPYARALVRGLNPARSFANMLEGRFPWDRDDRPSPFRAYPEELASAAEMVRDSKEVEVHPPPGVAPFELTATPKLPPIYRQRFEGVVRRRRKFRGTAHCDGLANCRRRQWLQVAGSGAGPHRRLAELHGRSAMDTAGLGALDSAPATSRWRNKAH